MNWSAIFLFGLVSLGICLIGVPLLFAGKILWDLNHPNKGNSAEQTPEEAGRMSRWLELFEPEKSLSREKDREEKGPQSGDHLPDCEEGGEETEE